MPVTGINRRACYGQKPSGQLQSLSGKGTDTMQPNVLEQKMAWTANRVFALIVGIIFTIIGLLGFIVAPTMAVGNLLGFDVDVVHNIIHLVTGVIGLVTVFLGGYQRFNQIFGIVYIILGILGLF